MSSKISIVCCIYAMFFVLGEIGGCVPILVKELTYSKILDSIIRNAINASIILFGLFVHRFNLNRISKVPTIGIIFLVSYSSCEFLLAFFSGMKIHSTEFLFSLFEFLAFLIICFLNYLAYFMIYEICLKNDQFSQLQQKNYELEKDKQLIMVSNENLQKLRSIKHDMINQYSTMKILLEKKDYAELENFLQNYQDGVIQPLSFISCDNDILSSVINMEHSKAQSEGIDFDCKLAVRKSLPFNSSDLVSLLSNLLDNALEACLYYNVEKKVIKIRVREYQDYLFIEVTNPVGKGITLEEIKKNKTTKKDKTIHGFGNKIISNIVKKYEGILKKQIIDDSYVVKIMLKEKKDEEA